MVFDINQIQEMLPHRYPFLLVDRITDVKNGEYVEGYLNISITNSVFQGHFPGHPIYPGVLIIEGMAQTGAILPFTVMDKDELSEKVVYFMSIDKAKFRKPVLPGDKLVYKVSTIKHRGKIWHLKGEAYVDGELVSEAELKAMIMDK
ncbi:3-hydroxyacyl-ACP dehydratase FabZ [Caminibacter pacificus]|uniref:3-hydroxyacyl-[acyl-carrier-protein] dehydratase FabZ n=1 Tax=Caminibacter pacificus TaxID=1424653 RepID=A0AAJ4RAY0_9BACT|nr:3-hydroxyacyl-ACP dehydratase FabZ [Caminibacter pacificus]NPA88344.1 3-hydroxyacyl-ACP dehydratase FabZ [Campylobacterota bacterium]QCI27427.1 3-hydroxyacyl-ACP dehydratase FabZ [Caminibacter pacificus]ROR38864.1 3-hydroxyacyl-[acyl-carrier-protein] dehydratase [Caminibacter pacificus]